MGDAFEAHHLEHLSTSMQEADRHGIRLVPFLVTRILTFVRASVAAKPVLTRFA
jgi:hypothetical protein